MGTQPYIEFLSPHKSRPNIKCEYHLVQYNPLFGEQFTRNKIASVNGPLFSTISQLRLWYFYSDWKGITRRLPLMFVSSKAAMMFHINQARFEHPLVVCWRKPVPEQSRKISEQCYEKKHQIACICTLFGLFLFVNATESQSSIFNFPPVFALRRTICLNGLNCSWTEIVK